MYKELLNEHTSLAELGPEHRSSNAQSTALLTTLQCTPRASISKEGVSGSGGREFSLRETEREYACAFFKKRKLFISKHFTLGFTF